MILGKRNFILLEIAVIVFVTDKPMLDGKKNGKRH